MKVEINKLKEVCENSKSMAEAARILGLNYKTLRRYTKQLEIFKPNPSGFGMNKKGNGKKISLEFILSGNYPSYQTNKLRKRLISEGYKENKCELRMAGSSSEMSSFTLPKR